MNFITRVAGIGLIICVARCWPRCSAAAPVGPVSYGRQIAPMFALHCAGCHGLSNPSSNLQVTRFASLRAGGNIGDEIVPGHPEKSILLDFIEGKERAQAEDAAEFQTSVSGPDGVAFASGSRKARENDEAAGPCFDLRLASVPAASGKPIQIRSRITAPL